MAFDIIQRKLRGCDEYLPTPSVPYSQVKKGARYVMDLFAQKRGLEIPKAMVLAPYLKQGQKRYADYLRLQLVAQAFRRAIELWIVLDLVLFLEEAGCAVNLTCFCPRQVTPRNFRILANR